MCGKHQKRENKSDEQSGKSTKRDMKKDRGWIAGRKWLTEKWMAGRKWLTGRWISPIDDENRNNKDKLNQISDHWKLHELIGKTDCKESMKEPTAALMQYGVSLRILVTQMRRVKWWFHFTRNNPSHTKRFYFRLKAIVGLENWNRVSPDMRQAWEDAANRFDMQYGLVRAWAMTPWVLDAPKPETPDPDKKLNEAIEAFKREKDHQDHEAAKWSEVENLMKEQEADHEGMRAEVEKRKEIARGKAQIVENALKRLEEIQKEWNKKQAQPKEDAVQ